ncbi:hypothetical protein FA95DRAFT_628068 [Auriscalpium vulgare]|uniref:Uncharacterized protein n=1 Tax=Auriscalpium vulgare TaxID=40419 RepID=A0ACB8RDN9_9AGAM|nr:hypothetical protein FA95DRAFT_628068 [Auriscalpium vulgare]
MLRERICAPEKLPSSLRFVRQRNSSCEEVGIAVGASTLKRCGRCDQWQTWSYMLHLNTNYPVNVQVLLVLETFHVVDRKLEKNCIFTSRPMYVCSPSEVSHFPKEGNGGRAHDMLSSYLYPHSVWQGFKVASNRPSQASLCPPVRTSFTLQSVRIPCAACHLTHTGPIK